MTIVFVYNSDQLNACRDVADLKELIQVRPA